MRYAFFIAAGIFFSAFYVHAALEDVTYPITELGNCESQEACFVYCDLGENYDACMAFAEAEELIPTEEIQEYRQIQEAVVQGGPGGCTSESECEAYCGDLTHIDECLSFAQEHGIMSEEELQEAQQVKAALDAGYTLPGGCTDEESCESYCSDASHMEECLTFGQAAGFISEEEVAAAEKFLTIMQSDGTPGGCQNQEECETYCADEANLDECLNFAVEAGFMTQEEADAPRETGIQSDEEFVGPGGCTDEESCRTYCSDPANQETCAVFSDESQPEEEYESPQEYPEQAYPSEEYPSEYQYESGQDYDIYEYGEEGSYGQDEFELFDPGDESFDFDQDQEDYGTYDEIYVEPPYGYGEQPSYEEPSHEDQPSYEEQPSYSAPSFSEPSPSGDSGAPPADSSTPPADSNPSPDSSGSESQSTSNAGFVNSARQLLEKVIQLLQI